MKKYVAAVILLVALYLGWDYAYHYQGLYLHWDTDAPVTSFMSVEGKTIYMEQEGVKTPFEIRGVDLGSGIPGEWSTDFAIDKETYLRWFGQMQEAGINTLRVYTVQQDVFYQAFYEYNTGRTQAGEQPLWLLQGVWVNDYLQNSAKDAYEAYLDTFLKDCRTMINVIHGQQKISLGRMASAGSGDFRWDVSRWVIGYILGVEWEDITVAYTDHKYEGVPGYDRYEGEYVRTTPEASPFECMLAQVADHVLAYETTRYHCQRLFALSNWPTTDPFEYELPVSRHFRKCASVDVEHLYTTEKVLSGQFASYHVYPYYPDYLSFQTDWTALGLSSKASHYEGSLLNTYRAYLTALNLHHTMPVVISEFGVSTGRGMAQLDGRTGRNQGHMSEKDQGWALQMCYEDIMAAGCAGCCIFTWQDEWFKRTWNTMYAVDLKRTPYWSDYQTNEQYFGLLSFDPGKEKSVCYVDGDLSEWTPQDVVTTNGDLTLSMKYDERFVYFLVQRPGLKLGEGPIYIPVDTTQKSGSSYCEQPRMLFDRGVDFLITLDGADNSRIQVQERYESLRANYAEYVYDFNTYLTENIPPVDSPRFVNIHLVLQLDTSGETRLDQPDHAQTYETGLLRYGNANPDSPDFDSLADFIQGPDAIELKLPWQILNFSDPSKMEIHDDYYDGNYGVAYQNIDELYVGITDGSPQENAQALAASRVSLARLPLKGWGNRVTYHERLKSSYGAVQQMWASTSPGEGGSGHEN